MRQPDARRSDRFLSSEHYRNKHESSDTEHYGTDEGRQVEGAKPPEYYPLYGRGESRLLDFSEQIRLIKADSKFKLQKTRNSGRSTGTEPCNEVALSFSEPHPPMLLHLVKGALAADPISPAT